LPDIKITSIFSTNLTVLKGQSISCLRVTASIFTQVVSSVGGNVLTYFLLQIMEHSCNSLELLTSLSEYISPEFPSPEILLHEANKSIFLEAIVN
jgi:hypothetical protein